MRKLQSRNGGFHGVLKNNKDKFKKGKYKIDIRKEVV